MARKTKEAFAKAEIIEKYLNEQMQQLDTFISDYEIDFRVSLWAERKYEDIEELQGNSFFETKPSFAFYKRSDTSQSEIDEHKQWLFEENHNEYPQIFKGQHHCYLLHDLIDHTYLSWQDIVDIEEVWFEVIVIVQNFSTLK